MSFWVPSGQRMGSVLEACKGRCEFLKLVFEDAKAPLLRRNPSRMAPPGTPPPTNRSPGNPGSTQ
eukprot:315892-Amphidinium_carterae.2